MFREACQVSLASYTLQSYTRMPEVCRDFSIRADSVVESVVERVGIHKEPGYARGGLTTQALTEVPTLQMCGNVRAIDWREHLGWPRVEQ